MARVVVTGSASGMGAAIRKRLEGAGNRVVGLDLRDAEILADLAVPGERVRAVARVREFFPDGLDRLVLCAGLGPHVKPPSRIAAVNYFGAVDLLDGLFPLLRRGEKPAAVVIGSNSAHVLPVDDHPYVLALLEHDEPRALALVDEAGDSVLAYVGSKNAVGKAVRRRALEWGRAGVRLNAVAPGPTDTPMLEAGLADPETGEAIRGFVAPIARHGRPEEVAALVDFLLGDDASWIHGAVYFVDGGMDAQLRPDRY
ncbi:MAG: NAD-dependent epimerase [Candidatus Binatia bacterium]|nr:MAG: NAD-dependent epimerase [Candidatus Binatia bacterium]